MLADKEPDYDWEHDGIPVVDATAYAAQIAQAAAEDVFALLDERHGGFDKAAVGKELGL